MTASGLALLAAALLALLADVLLLQAHPGYYAIPIGNFRDEYFITGVHRQEIAPDGRTYRWTQEQSSLWLKGLAVGDQTLLRLDLGGRPEPADLTLTADGAPWVSFRAADTARHYTLLLPPAPDGELRIRIASPTFAIGDDPRQLGVKVEGFALQREHAGAPLPSPDLYLLQVALLALVAALTHRLGWRRWLQAAALLAVGGLTALMISAQLLLAPDYLLRLAVGGLALLALTVWALPVVERWACRAPSGFLEARELRVLWSLALMAVVVRWAGVLYPTFGGQDLGRNLGRLIATTVGQLYIIAPSGEFAKGLTIYPTGPYLAIMPVYLAIGDMASLLQGSLAMMDGFTALLTALVAHRLGGGRHAGRIALALYAANIGAFGGMSYSFSAQIFGQWFTAPLALLLLTSAAPPSRRTWLLAMVIMAFGLFSHIGVMFLSVGWMGLILLLTTIGFRRIPWWGWGMFAGLLLVTFGFLYVEIIGPTLAHAAQTVVPQSRGAGTLFPGYRILLVNGLRLAYSDIGLVLAPLGLLLMAPLVPGARTWLQARVVPLAWLGSAFFFFWVDLLLNVQVRYFYFMLPLVLPLIALPLGRIARHRSGALAAWALTAAIMLPQLLLWYAATWADGKVPMTPLTH